MICAPLPANEAQRQHWLDRLGIVDTAEEQAYDDIVELAAQICDTPVALVSLIDDGRQWFKAHHGLAVRQTPREQAFCAHAILGDDVFVIEDSERDPRFHDNPLVLGEPHVKFYAGAPLILHDDIRLGTLCVIDRQARSITPDQIHALQALARQVVTQMQLRLRVSTLEQLDQAKDEFISMINHELRTPLTSVIGSLGLLQHTGISGIGGEAAKLVNIAKRNADHLLDMVNDILDVAKLAAGQTELERVPRDLSTLLQRAMELNMPFCQQCETTIRLTLQNPDSPVMAAVDEQRFLQVMNNLISNAAKFTRPDDTIEVRLDTLEDSARISVSDHGKGITPEQQEQLFGKFVQLHDKNQSKAPGTGLGLHICKQIVELHKGKIGVESVPNECTTFYFTLPLARPGAA